MILWLLIIMPQVMQHNFGFSEENVAIAISVFYNSNFLGMIAGCFIWPHVMHLIYKRTAILISLTLMLLLNTLMGLLDNYIASCVIFFFIGLSSNFNTVGKDFIFEFLIDGFNRQYAYTVKSSFNIVAIFGSPMAGYLLYEHFNQSFSSVVLCISIFIFIGILLWVIVFFLDYDVEHQIRLDHEDDERHSLSQFS